MTVRDYLTIVRERLTVVAITVALVALVAFGLSLRLEPEYMATGRLRVKQVAAGTDAGRALKDLNFQNDVLTEGELLRSTQVATRVADRLELRETPEELIERLTVAPYGNAAVLVVSASANSPTGARDLANAFAEEYLKSRKEDAIEEARESEQQIARKIAEVQGQLDSADRELGSLRLGSAQYDIAKGARDQAVSLLAVYTYQRQALLDVSVLENLDVGEIIESASVAKVQSSVNHLRNAILGLVVGIPLALGLALLLDALNDTVKTKEEAETLVGAQALALIPDDPTWREQSVSHLASRESPQSHVAEAYRSLRISLEAEARGRGIRHVLLTSAGPGEGKTVSAANLAVAFAEAGHPVTLVAADLRRPRLHEFFGMDASPGLTDFVRGDASTKLAVRQVESNLCLVASGSREDRPDRLFSAVDVKALLTKLAGRGSNGTTTKGHGSNGEKKANGNGHAYLNARKTNGHRNGTAPRLLIIDAPGILGAAESSSLVSKVDEVVLVLRVGHTKRIAAGRAAEQIRKVGGKVLGLILIGVQEDKSYGFYSSGDENRPRKLATSLTKAIMGLLR